jgi:hypothetical protein
MDPQKQLNAPLELHAALPAAVGARGGGGRREVARVAGLTRGRPVAVAGGARFEKGDQRMGNSGRKRDPSCWPWGTK